MGNFIISLKSEGIYISNKYLDKSLLFVNLLPTKDSGIILGFIW
jgi:hypothetical protein